MQISPHAKQKAVSILDQICAHIDWLQKNCGTGDGGFQPGNDCARGGDGGDSGTAVADKPHHESQHESHGNSRVLFEVAPDPHDESLSKRWNSLTASDRTEISDVVANKVLPDVFKTAGVKAELHKQFGGYLDDTNPSFAAIVSKDADMKSVMDVAKLSGFALSQDSMMVVSLDKFEGADKVGLISVDLPSNLSLDGVHQIYQKLRTIDNGVIQGHTTVDGQMMIVDFSGDSHGLAEKIESKLGSHYDVGVADGYVSFPHKGEYNYDDNSGESSELSGRREEARQLRSEAAGLIERELQKRGKSYGQPGETSGRIESAKEILDFLQKNCGTGSGGFQRGNECAGDGVGGDTAQSAPNVGASSTNKPNNQSNRDKPENQSQSFKGAPANPDGKSTFEQYRNADGTWTKEREVLHDHIISEAIKGVTATKEPVAYLMGGGSASGKSFALKSGLIQMPENIVTIDSDEIKTKIPEYRDMHAAGNFGAAAFVHEESSYLSKMVMENASKESYNMLLDGTGDSGIDDLSKKIARMRDNGSKVVANYVTVDTETAVQRNRERAAKTGRFVPEEYVRQIHSNVSKIVPLAIKKGLFDEFKLIDTNDKTPLLIAEAKGTNLTIHDQKAWDRFVAKGN